MFVAEKVVLFLVMSPNFSKYLLTAVITALVVGGGTYLFVKDKFTVSVTSEVESKSTNESNTVDNSKNEVEIVVPNDWKRRDLVPSGDYMLTGEDKNNNFTIQIFVSKDNSSTLSCSEVFKDSEELIFTDPLPGQSPNTNLTFTSMYLLPDQQTICDVMVTGDFKAKNGVSINGQDPLFLNSLPAYRVKAHINNIDSSTNFPLAKTVFASSKFAELITALKSIQVK